MSGTNSGASEQISQTEHETETHIAAQIYQISAEELKEIKKTLKILKPELGN